MHLTLSRTGTDDDFQVFWKYLHPKLTAHLCSLVLELRSCYSKSAISTIFDAITQMPKLQSLSIDKCSAPSYNFPIVKSATVKHLEMDDTFISFDMPELESFVGPLPALAQPNQPLVYSNLKRVTLTHSSVELQDKSLIERLARVQMPELQSFEGMLQALALLDNIAESRMFTKLKRVTITARRLRLEDKSMLHRLAHVETLILAIFSIDDWVLPAICDACPALRQLYFVWDQFNIKPTTLGQLSKFVNLRELIFNSMYMNHRLPLDFDFGLSQLTQLELLNLGSDVLEARSLMRLSKSIRCLTVQIAYTNEERILKTITDSLPQLQKLRLNYSSYPRVAVDKRTMMSLHHLKHLEVLVIENAKISESVFLDTEAPMPEMRELVFVNCELGRHRFRGWKRMFPNLEQIKIPRKLTPSYFSKDIKSIDLNIWSRRSATPAAA
ncbi:uncharacterized protein LOC126574029 [Anopheles aquasalis]|uniref:uncharacterized protein LOC126574029 n=1 Tax=Anopheles aquasalis TaxID=42839 RepID=UPI00215AD8CD|nr:uncharacterized protein LOC126574029 [Anopheles aquasalis]